MGKKEEESTMISKRSNSAKRSRSKNDLIPEKPNLAHSLSSHVVFYRYAGKNQESHSVSFDNVKKTTVEQLYEKIQAAGHRHPFTGNFHDQIFPEFSFKGKVVHQNECLEDGSSSTNPYFIYPNEILNQEFFDCRGIKSLLHEKFTKFVQSAEDLPEKMLVGPSDNKEEVSLKSRLSELQGDIQEIDAKNAQEASIYARRTIEFLRKLYKEVRIKDCYDIKTPTKEQKAHHAILSNNRIVLLVTSSNKLLMAERSEEQVVILNTQKIETLILENFEQLRTFSQTEIGKDRKYLFGIATNLSTWVFTCYKKRTTPNDLETQDNFMVSKEYTIELSEPSEEDIKSILKAMSVFLSDKSDGECEIFLNH